MTKIIVSLIIAIIFIIVSLSTSLIPCRNSDKVMYKEWGVCSLDGEKMYYGTDKLSDSYIAGIITFVIVFLICLAVMSLIFRKKKVITV